MFSMPPASTTSASPARRLWAASGNRLQPRAAELIDRHRRHLVRQPGSDGRLARWIGPGPALIHHAHQHLIHFARFHLALLQCRGEHLATQFRGPSRLAAHRQSGLWLYAGR